MTESRSCRCLASTAQAGLGTGRCLDIPSRRYLALTLCSVFATLIAVSTVAACGVPQANNSEPCSFNLPPGENGHLILDNDTSEAVSWFQCSDKTCGSGIDPKNLAPGNSQRVNYDLCAGASIGIVNKQSALIGCFALPIGPASPTRTVAVSSTKNCGTAGLQPMLQSPGIKLGN